MDVGSNMYWKGPKLSISSRPFGPWPFNQFEQHIIKNICNNAEYINIVQHIPFPQARPLALGRR